MTVIAAASSAMEDIWARKRSVPSSGSSRHCVSSRVGDPASAGLPAGNETPEEVADDPALAILRRQVAARLSGVCADFDPGEFTELVERIARFKRRWQRREAPGLEVGPLSTL